MLTWMRLKMKEAMEFEERKKDPYLYELGKQHEDDIKELDNIIGEQ